MKKLALLFWLAILGSISNAEQVGYRDFLVSIENSKNWFRIGSYELRPDSRTIDMDLYYFDPSLRPDGNVSIAPTFSQFQLICVWRDIDHEWRHKVLFQLARASFQRVVDVSETSIAIEIMRKDLPSDDPGGSPESRVKDRKIDTYKVSLNEGEPIVQVERAPASEESNPFGGKTVSIHYHTYFKFIDGVKYPLKIVYAPNSLTRADALWSIMSVSYDFDQDGLYDHYFSFNEVDGFLVWDGEVYETNSKEGTSKDKTRSGLQPEALKPPENESPFNQRVYDSIFLRHLVLALQGKNNLE